MDVGDAHGLQIRLDETDSLLLLAGELGAGVIEAAAINDIGIVFFRKSLDIHKNTSFLFPG